MIINLFIFFSYTNYANVSFMMRSDCSIRGTQLVTG